MDLGRTLAIPGKMGKTLVTKEFKMLFDLARLVLGLLFFYNGLNGFFHFRPLPPMNPQMTKFNEALQGTVIIMPVVKIFEVLFGLALILNVWTFLATLALGPICYFIIVAHLWFNRPKGIFMAGLIGTSYGLLVWHHWLELNLLLQR